MWNDDITFCMDNKCEITKCPRNMKNIRDKSIPHSYFMDVPPDCLKRTEKCDNVRTGVFAYLNHGQEESNKQTNKMDKLEKVIKGLETCLSTDDGDYKCERCPYKKTDLNCIKENKRDALKLLKEQQAEINKLNGFINGFSRDAVPIVRCVNCISRIPAKDPDCTVCNNPKSPCYQREIRDSDFCALGKAW